MSPREGSYNYITSDPNFLSTGEAAGSLGIARSTLRRAVEAKQIHASRTPGRHLRFARAEVARFRVVLHGEPAQ